MARTRERMAETIDEIDGEISEHVDAAKRKVDPMRLAREHPWPALGIAVAIGAVIGGSGADEKAAVAMGRAAKRTGSATSNAAKNVVSKVKQHRQPPESARRSREGSKPTPSEPAFSERVFGAASAPLAGVIDRILDELRAASRDLGARLGSSGKARGTRRGTPTAAEVVVIEAIPMAAPAAARAEDVVPVPPEMLPTELDARADAVEAMGGGTHEPPLAPGAGDLGARWA